MRTATTISMHAPWVATHVATLLATLLACTPTSPPPPGPTSADAPPVPTSTPAAAPTSEPAAPTPAPAGTSAKGPSSPSSPASDTTGADDMPGPPASTTPASTNNTPSAGDVPGASDSPDLDGLTDEQRDAFARALEPRSPEAVTIAAARRRGGGWIVLVHVKAAARWQAAQQQGKALERRLEALAAAQERCEDEASSMNGVTGCVLAAAPDPALGWDALGHHVGTWELARIEEIEGNEPRVAQRRVLSDLVTVPADEPPVPLKLQVFDIDRDGGDEITVVAPLELPPDDAFTQTYGALGAIVDGRSFKLQFAVARMVASEYSHAEDASSDTIEVRWFAADDDRDGHPDLRVRETRRRSDGEGPPTHTNRKALCPYLPAEDRWHCPDPPFAEGLLPPPGG